MHSAGSFINSPALFTCHLIDEANGSIAQDRARNDFDCRMLNDPATINRESTNENNTDVDRWADARRLRINGKPCS
jgi:hypothetical protein